MCFLLVVGYGENDVKDFEYGDGDCCLDYKDCVVDLRYFDFEKDLEWVCVVYNCSFDGFFGNVL